MAFNGDNVKTVVSKKHLGLVFGSKYDFNKHMSNK